MSDSKEVLPCVDGPAHKFVANDPQPGQWGYTIIYCEKCGRTREEARR